MSPEQNPEEGVRWPAGGGRKEREAAHELHAGLAVAAELGRLRRERRKRKWQISVLGYACFAYTIYGVAITPALFAALTWKRATRAGGITSIVSRTLAVILLELVLPRLAPSIMVAASEGSTFGADPWGIPSTYPAALISIGSLIVVSLLTPPPKPEELAPLFKS